VVVEVFFEGAQMFDLLMIVSTAVFFLVGIAYTVWCDKLK